jgi:hypothetical protein
MKLKNNMMRSLEKRQTNRVITVLLFTFFLFSCKPEEKDAYYYGCYTESGNLDFYIIKLVDKDNKLRKEKDYILYSDGKQKKFDSNTYEVSKEELFKVTSSTKPYLTIKNKDCVEFKYDNEFADFAQTRICFLKTVDLKLNEQTFSKVYKFLKVKGGGSDNVESNVYYDENFILLKEEYVSGYRSYYKIERLDTIIEFKNTFE